MTPPYKVSEAQNQRRLGKRSKEWSDMNAHISTPAKLEPSRELRNKNGIARASCLSINTNLLTSFPLS